MKKIVCVMIAILFCMCANLSALAEETAKQYSYTYPTEPTIEISERYERQSYEHLDACLYACDGQLYILVEQHDNDTVTTGLMRCEIQDARIAEELKPEILVTVYPEEGFAADEPEPTPTPTPTPTPSATPKATATTKPGAQTPGSKTTPAPTPIPTEAEVYHCRFCSFSSTDFNEVALHRLNAHPETVPTPNPTPAPTPKGHWEMHWVVDSPEVGHGEIVCNVCGHHSMSESENDSHQKAHALAGEGSGWHNIWVVDTPEQGHYEEVWVLD